MNKYQLKMKTPTGLGTEYVYVESYKDNFERFLEEHNIKYKKYNYKTNQDKEIERLNNIINELEKWTWYYQDEVIKDQGQYAQDMINQSYYEGKIDGIQGIIDKLKELKGHKDAME